LGKKNVCLSGKLFIFYAIVTIWLNFRHERARTGGGRSAGSAESAFAAKLLESAVFLVHMEAETQGNRSKRSHRVIASRVFLGPFWRLLACPFIQHTRHPQHAGAFRDDASARPQRAEAPAVLYGKN
jgi:hypothetical protein